jgi:nucleoside-triphosphatase
MTAGHVLPHRFTPKLLLQGLPKVGKTTVVERLVERLQGEDMPAAGFLTRELHEQGRRVGFAVRSLRGPEAVIAHQDWVTGVQVGRFRVDVAAFERVALPALTAALEGDAVVVIIDEIARMELASAAFVDLLGQVMDRPAPVVATVHVHPHPVTDALLRRPDVQVIEVNSANRDELPERLLARLVNP